MNECRDPGDVHEGTCPEGNMSEYIQGGDVHEGICPEGNMSKWEYIQGDTCLGGMYPGGNCRGEASGRHPVPLLHVLL